MTHAPKTNHHLSVDIATSPDEIAAVKEMIQEFFDVAPESLDFQNTDDEMRTFPDAYEFLLLGKIDGNNAGTVSLKDLGDGICEMKRMFVRPQYRQYGLGEKLAVKLITEARKSGYNTMLLDTIKRFDSAVRLYKGLGFLETKAYYHNPIPDVVYMAKTLK